MTLRTVFLFTFLFGTIAGAQIFIPFSNWNCQAPVVSVSDTLNADFVLGTTSNTTVSGASVVLSAGQTTGTFTSRVFDVIGNCPPLSLWKSVSWKASLPYGKLLPDFAGTIQNESVADYSALASGSFMSGDLTSWHMQETSTGTAPGGLDVTDNSGNAVHGTLVGGITLNAVGKIGRAITFGGTNGYINFGTPATVTGLGNYSISFWIYPNSITTDQTIIYRSDNDLQEGFWVNLTATAQIHIQIVDASVDTEVFTVETLPLSTWSHVVMTTNSSLTSANTKVYINGVQATYTGAVDGLGVHKAAATRPLSVGAPGTNSPGYLNARLQEMTIMGRIYTAAEVVELYRRGINRVKMQFRSCILSNCADLPIWQGPDGTAATFYTELYNNSIQSTWLGTVYPTSPVMTFSNFVNSAIPNNRYFQYKATLETDNTTYLPDLKSVVIIRP